MSDVPPEATPAPPAGRLTPEDFDRQDDELDAMRERGLDAPDWEYCEGFLAALVCTRREVPEDEVWPALVDDGFRPMEHMEFVWRWRRRRQEIAAALDAPVDTLEDERAYLPEIVDLRGALALARLEPVEAEAEQTEPTEAAASVEPESAGSDATAAKAATDDEAVGDGDEDGPLPAYGQHWAGGFLDAVEAFADDWTPPRDAETAAWLEESLAAVGGLLADDRDPPTVSLAAEDGPPSVSERRLEAVDIATWAVYDLRRLWKAIGPRVAPVRRPDDKVGPNQPCPCGSGKKYKRCHGA